jgi:hypothetical protein
VRDDEGSAAADGAVERYFAPAHLEAVAGVHRLDVEDLAPGEAKDALHRRRHVFVHAIGELDDDDGALPWCAHKPPNNSTRSSAELAEHNLHKSNPSTLALSEHKGLSSLIRSKLVRNAL